MPKKLKLSPNERVDIPDFLRGANDYTAETSAFELKNVLLGDRSQILEGFRVRVINTVASPAKVVVYNGNALDGDGVHLNNEADPAYAQEVTLTGASTTFYVEIVFEEVDSDEDARAFWDPTIDNTAPIPDGQEFDASVVTRTTPTWRIVRPVSTTGFDYSLSNPTSKRIPLVRLRTDGSNQIVAGGDNPGLLVVYPATVLTEDAALGATKLKVADARLFSSGADNGLQIDPDLAADPGTAFDVAMRDAVPCGQLRKGELAIADREWPAVVPQPRQ